MIQQISSGAPLAGTIPAIVKETGAGGLFRGLITSVGREGVFTLGYLGLGPALTTICKNDYAMGESQASVVGAVGGGVVASLLSHPLDTIKTCMQGDIQQAKFGSMMGTASALKAEGGVGAFYRGAGWRTSRLICLVFIIGQIKEPIAQVRGCPAPPLPCPGRFAVHQCARPAVLGLVARAAR